MTDFLSELVEGAPEAREVTVGGKTGTVHFRRITAGEREQLLKGMKIAHTPGTGGSIEIDLAENERQRHLLVCFSVCNPDGSRHFKRVEDVKKLPSATVAALARHAEEVNREDEEPGKA
jgi:hypothetical protein